MEDAQLIGLMSMDFGVEQVCFKLTQISDTIDYLVPHKVYHGQILAFVLSFALLSKPFFSTIMGENACASMYVVTVVVILHALLAAGDF